MGPGTYDDDEATKHQVPQNVFLPAKLRVCRLKLADILEDEVCVHDYPQLWTGEEEAGDEAPYLRWELEDLEVVEVEPGVGKEAHVTSNRGNQYGCREGPAKARVRIEILAM